jgi:two-component system, sensor histidine kinase LadS
MGFLRLGFASLFFGLFLSNCKIAKTTEEGLTLGPKTPGVFLFGQSLRYIKVEGKVPLEEIQGLPESAFQKPKSDFLNFGISTQSIWIYVDIEKLDDTNWFIELQSPLPSLLRYYIVKNDTILYSLETGSSAHSETRFIHHPFFVFPVSVPAGTYRIYLNLESNDSITIPLVLWRRDKFFYYDGWKYIFFSFFFGAMVALSIYNFLLFVSIKDRAYLYYVGYIFTFFVFLSSSYGLFGYFLNDVIGFFPEIILPLTAVLTAVFALAFTRRFLQVEANFPRLNHWMIFGLVFGLFKMFIMFFIPIRIAVLIANLYPLLGVTLIVSAIVLAIRKGYKPAYYFAIAWVGVILSVSLFIFSNLGILQATLVTQYAQILGASFEALVLSLALGYRINDLRFKEEESRRMALEKEREARDIQAKMADSFKRFVPLEFLRYLGKESILDVERGHAVVCKMSVLFMDIRGFTKISEKHTAEETFAFLNSFLGEMEPVIQKRGGFIDKFIGDAILALFPDPSQAMLCALEMLEVSHHNQSNPFGLRIGIGIHSGEMVMGTIGSPKRLDTTVIGDVVNLASRVEGLTKEYQVSLLVTETVLNINTENLFFYRELDTVRVKGKQNKIKVFELLGIQSFV